MSTTTSPLLSASLSSSALSSMAVLSLTASAMAPSMSTAFLTPQPIAVHSRSSSLLAGPALVAPALNQSDAYFSEPLLAEPSKNELFIEPPESSIEHYSLRTHLGLPLAIAPAAVSLRRAPVKIIGHRGALYDALENTRQAFQRCADLGCDAVELDVFLLKDGTLIVFHGGGTDQNPGDLTGYCIGMDGKSILDLTYEECQQLQFNPQNEEFPCPLPALESAQIPTLEQVLLDLKPTTTNIKIELKGPGTVEPVLELVDRLDMVHQCQFSCFDHVKLALLRQLRPQLDSNGNFLYRTGALFDDTPDDFIAAAMACGANEVHLRYDECTVDRVLAARLAGLESMAWYRGPVGMRADTQTKYLDIGNEDERCYQALMDTGVDAICVNRPDLAMCMTRPVAQ